jgi:hypothetical protein
MSTRLDRGALGGQRFDVVIDPVGGRILLAP